MLQKFIIEIRAGAGGEEAALFAANLARMYQKYSAKKGWKFTIVDHAFSSLRGIKTFIAKIEGESACDYLKNEAGVHRIQRIPITEKSGRVHTSTASVAILQLAETKVAHINPADLEVSFFRSSGPGGQNVQKVETAVRILHKPSGIVVSSQSERSQYANRESALAIIAAKLYEHEQQTASAKLGAERREQIGSAERVEKIRTYNFPDDRITDHRINKKWSRVEKVLDGDLDQIIEAFQKKQQEK